MNLAAILWAWYWAISTMSLSYEPAITLYIFTRSSLVSSLRGPIIDPSIHFMAWKIVNANCKHQHTMLQHNASIAISCLSFLVFFSNVFVLHMYIAYILYIAYLSYCMVKFCSQTLTPFEANLKWLYRYKLLSELPSQIYQEILLSMAAVSNCNLKATCVLKCNLKTLMGKFKFSKQKNVLIGKKKLETSLSDPKRSRFAVLLSKLVIRDCPLAQMITLIISSFIYA